MGTNKIFDASLSRTLRYEGTYCNDPNDSGGETYMGVSRNNFPNWDGWKIIDSFKKDKKFPSILDSNKNLLQEVKDFYYDNFWTKLQISNTINPKISAMIFDTAVNMGISAAVKLTQEALKLPQTGIINLTMLNKINKIK